MSESDRPALDEVEPGVPATTELPEDVPPGWEAAEEPPPLDVPQGAESWGTTAEEELQGEPLDLRVLREEPDVFSRGPASSGDEDVDGRGVSVLEPGSEDGLTDAEPAAVGELDLAGDSTLGPEEAAMRVDEEPAGLTYDATPGYLDEELGP